MLEHFELSKSTLMLEGNIGYARKMNLLQKMIEDDDMTIICDEMEPEEFDSKEHQVLIDMEKQVLTIAKTNEEKVTFAVV